MNKKIIFIFLMLIVLTGCSSEYKLEISNNKFNESISVTIPKNLIPEQVADENMEVEYDDPITPFLEDETAALTTNDVFYKKKVSNLDEFYKVKLSYKYDEETFKQSNSINTCFQYPELDFSKNYYINLQGTFYCLYSDSIDIKITTKNKVNFNNADDVSGNTYIWHINEENVNYVDIKMDIEKGTPKNIILGVCLLVVLISGTIFIVYKFINKNKIRNSI